MPRMTSSQITATTTLWIDCANGNRDRLCRHGRPAFSRSVADEDHVLVAVVRAEVEPAVERIHDEPRLADEAEPLRRREPVQAEGRRCPQSARTARAFGSPRPSRRARRSPARARANGRPSPRCRLDSGRRRRRRSVRRARAVRRPRAAHSFGFGFHVEQCERNGQMARGTRSETGGSRRSPSRRSTSSRRRPTRGGARDSSISGDESTPITRSRLRRSGPRSVPFRPRARRPPPDATA